MKQARASELVDILRQLDLVKTSKLLTESQKKVVYQEMIDDLPLEMLSKRFEGTRAIMLAILTEEIKNASTPEPTKDPAPKKQQRNLLSVTDGNARRPRAKKNMVKQEKEKRR